MKQIFQACVCKGSHTFATYRAQFSFEHIFPTLLPHHFCYLLIPNIGISKEQQIKAIATQTGNNQSKTCTNRVQIRCANLCGLSYLLRLIPPQHSNIVTFFFHILLKCLLLVPQCQWEWKGRVSNVAFCYNENDQKCSFLRTRFLFSLSIARSLSLYCISNIQNIDIIRRLNGRFDGMLSRKKLYLAKNFVSFVLNSSVRNSTTENISILIFESPTQSFQCLIKSPFFMQEKYPNNK